MDFLQFYYAALGEQGKLDCMSGGHANQPACRILIISKMAERTSNRRSIITKKCSTIVVLHPRSRWQSTGSDCSTLVLIVTCSKFTMIAATHLGYRITDYDDEDGAWKQEAVTMIWTAMS